MEWEEFVNYMNATTHIAKLKEILQTTTNNTSDTDTVIIEQQIKQHYLCFNLNVECSSALNKVENSLLILKDTANGYFGTNVLQIKKEHKKLDESNHNWPYIFGIPYFKDQHSFSPPPNSDTTSMKTRNFVSTVNLPLGHLWKAEDKTYLQNSVKKYMIQKNKKASQCQIEIDENLNETDWAHISLKNLKDRHGLLECMGMWNSYLNPNLNKKKWTREEENRLKFCAKKYNYQDWEAIARELNTNRSSYQCIEHLQTHFNKNVTKKKWTDEEDRQLEKLVRQYQLGEYIPWAKVASHMPGRTKFQVYNHWAYTLQPNIKKGRFTKLEDAIILAGIKKFGTDYGRISRFLKDRTSIQIRNRFNTFLQYQQGFEPWTSEEDVLLLKLVKELGKGNWCQISNSFKNRNRTQLRHRYTAIMKWIKKNPDKELNIQHRKVHSKIGGPQEIWENILYECDLEEDYITELINEIGLEDVTRDRTQKYVSHMILAKFWDILKDMYITQEGESDINFSKNEIISLCELLKRQLKLFQCLIPFNWNYIANDSTFFECTSSVIQDVNQTLSSSRFNDLYKHTENEENVSVLKFYEMPTTSNHSLPESDILNYNLNCSSMKINKSRVQHMFNPLPFLNALNPEEAPVEEPDADFVYNNFEMQTTDEIYQVLSSNVNGDFYEECVNLGSSTADLPNNSTKEDFEVRYSENPEENYELTDLDSFTSNGGIDKVFVHTDSDLCHNNVSNCSEGSIGGNKYMNVLMTSASSKDCEMPSLFFNIPPSHTSLVGFYTLFLNLDTIKKCATTKQKFGNVNSTKSANFTKHVPNVESSETEKAAALWKIRFFSVFLWPKLMSINGPEQFNSQKAKSCPEKIAVKTNVDNQNLLKVKAIRRKGLKKTVSLKEKASQQKEKSCPEKIAVETNIENPSLLKGKAIRIKGLKKVASIKEKASQQKEKSRPEKIAVETNVENPKLLKVKAIRRKGLKKTVSLKEKASQQKEKSCTEKIAVETNIENPNLLKVKAIRRKGLKKTVCLKEKASQQERSCPEKIAVDTNVENPSLLKGKAIRIKGLKKVASLKEKTSQQKEKSRPKKIAVETSVENPNLLKVKAIRRKGLKKTVSLKEKASQQKEKSCTEKIAVETNIENPNLLKVKAIRRKGLKKTVCLKEKASQQERSCPEKIAVDTNVENPSLLKGKAIRIKGLKKVASLKEKTSQQKEKSCPEKIAVETNVENPSLLKGKAIRRKGLKKVVSLKEKASQQKEKSCPEKIVVETNVENPSLLKVKAIRRKSLKKTSSLNEKVAKQKEKSSPEKIAVKMNEENPSFLGVKPIRRRGLKKTTHLKEKANQQKEKSSPENIAAKTNVENPLKRKKNTLKGKLGIKDEVPNKRRRKIKNGGVLPK